MDEMFPLSLCMLVLIHEALASFMLAAPKLLLLVLCICGGWAGDSALVNFPTSNNSRKI